MGTVACTLEHEVNSSLGKGGGSFVRFNNTISGSITVAPNQSKSLAFTKFMVFVDGRIGNARTAKLGIVRQRLSVREEVMTNTTHFNWSYWTTGSTGMKVQDMLAGTGLWQPMPNTDFAQWKASMDLVAWRAGGVRQVQNKAGDDIIIDLCLQGQIPKPNQPGPGQNPQQNKPQVKQLPPPPPGANWLWYECDMAIEEIDRVIIHKPLNTKPQPKPPAVDATGPPGKWDKLNIDQDTAVKTTTPDKEQRVSAPTWYIYLFGWALRVTEKIPTPRITAINPAGGGAPVKVTQKYAWTSQKQLYQEDNNPVYYAQWYIQYECLQDPTGAVEPTNPFLQI